MTTYSSTGTERVQVVVFMRHGIAVHNIVNSQTRQRPDLNDPILLDPPLVLEGKTRSIVAGYKVQEWLKQHTQQQRIELYVTSPLTRCIQTLTLAFLRGDEYYDHQHSTQQHQHRKTHHYGSDQYHNIQQQPTDNTDPIPIVCKENLREAFGKHYPDRRREKSVLMKHWPMVQFEDTMTENDEAWKVDVRETWSDIERRVDNFLQWLIQRTERTIVVISHGVWIETLLRIYAPDFLGQRRVHNLDTFACQCVSNNGKFVRIQWVQYVSDPR